MFDLRLRGRIESTAFIDMGDQFIALDGGTNPGKDEDRYFGLVVDDRARARRALEQRAPRSCGAGPQIPRSWGNHLQVVEYRNVQFTKAPEVLARDGARAPREVRGRAARSSTGKGIRPGQSSA